MEQNEIRTHIVTAGWTGHESNKEQPVNTAILAAALATIEVADWALREARPLHNYTEDEKYGWDHGWACAMSAARKTINDLLAQLQQDRTSCDS